MKRVAAMTVAALCLALAAPVSADEWGSQDADTGAHPDGGDHTFCYGFSLPVSLEPNVDQAEYNALEADTDADVAFNASCDLSGEPQTDVRWLEGDLPGSRGSAPCAIYHFSPVHCDRYNATIDLAEVNVGANDEWDQNKTACHELGHTVGLSHGNGDCMIGGERPDLTDTWVTYGPHHTNDHINTWF